MHFSDHELREMGIEAGANVQVHRSVSCFGGGKIRIADNVRIDCFALISAGDAGITIGSYIHIGAGSFLFGSGGAIVMEDYSGLSSRVSLYTSTDDYVGGYMTNPTVPDEFRKVRSGDIILRKHAVVGASSVILPGVELKTGAAVGALTCVERDVEEFEICVSTSRVQRSVGKRESTLIDLEKRFVETQKGRLQDHVDRARL